MSTPTRDDDQRRDDDTSTQASDLFTTGTDTDSTANQDSPQQGRRDIGGYVPTTT